MSRRLSITWSEGPSYPILVKGCAAGVIDGRLYVASGMSWPWRSNEYGFWLQTEDAPSDPPPFVSPSDEPHEYTVGSWHLLPVMPRGHGWTSGCAVAGGLAVVGGRGLDMKAMTDVLFLDIKGGAKTWRRLPDLPTPAMFPITFADGDYIYTGFGLIWPEWESRSRNLDPNIYRLNVRTDEKWQSIAKFPGKTRWGLGMAMCRGQVYVIGGVNYLDPVESLDFPRDPRYAYLISPSIVRAKSPDEKQWYNVTEWYSDVWKLDLASGSWEQLNYAPRAFTATAFTVDDRWVVLAGGRNFIVKLGSNPVRITAPVHGQENIDSSEVWALDTENHTWQQLSPLPYGICSNGVALWKDKVYLVGNEGGHFSTLNTVFVGRIEVCEEGSAGGSS